MPLPVIYHPRFLDHRQPGADHPERPERLLAIIDRLESEGLWTNILHPEPASDKALARAHDPAYLKKLAAFGPGRWDADTYVGVNTFDIARLAAGGAMLAAETAWRERGPALALVRPPGHHATRDRAMGFCYLNSVAVAAAAHVAAGRGRVAIVDVDVHHGNGTQDIFYASPEVFYASLHQWPHYPGTGSARETGSGAGSGSTLNIPLPAGSSDAAYVDAIERSVVPAFIRFQPSLLIVSLGADAHAMDPLAGMQLSTPGYLNMLALLSTAAGRLCEGRTAYVLEGGYHLEATADVIAGLASAVAGHPFTPQFPAQNVPLPRR